MSRMLDELDLPEGIAIPEPVERAWAWMESQGHGQITEHGYYVTPYPAEAELGPVFDPDLDLVGWMQPTSPGADRLLPIATVTGSGSLLALWLDDDDRERFVVLGDEGDHFLVADDARDLLRLVAIGYEEWVAHNFGAEPDYEESVEAVADFRAWVESTFEVDVPALWELPVDDHGFSQWMNAHIDV